MSDISNYISVAEYAKLHNKSPESVKKKCQNGTLKTAMKIGRNWIIDKNEPYSDKRIKSGKYVGWRKKN